MYCRALLLFVLTLAPIALPAEPDQGGPDTLESRLREIAGRAGGVVGIAARHIESGEEVAVRGRDGFPMASVYKLPIAVQFLHRVDQGDIALDAPVRVEARHLRPGYSPLADRAPNSGLSVPARELLGLMVSQSDNSASDLILELAGGPSAVTARMRALAIEGIRVDRSEAEMAMDYHGVEEATPAAVWTRDGLTRLMRAVPEGRRKGAAERALTDPRDTATPEGMLALLVRVHRGDLLRPDSSGFLVRVLEATTTGPGRLKGLLPPGTVVAHKTGSGGVTAGVNLCTNDVGIVTLPGGAGHVAVAVFIRGSNRSEAVRDRSIAEIARAFYDHWSSPRTR